MNRIESHRAQVQAVVDSGVKPDGTPVDPAALARLEKTLDLEPLEHFAWQQAQALAFASGRISQAEAETIYLALGEAPGQDGWAPNVGLALKVAITQFMPTVLSAGRGA